MAVTQQQVMDALADVPLPAGGSLGSADAVRALQIDDGNVRFVLELPDATGAAQVEADARRRLEALPGVSGVSIVTTAGVQARKAPAADAPNLRIGGHPKPQAGPAQIAGINRIVAVGSGKGGVGKSTLTANLAVALARQGRRVGLLDADIYGPSQPRMMGTTERPTSVGNRIQPVVAHGVKIISVGMMIEDGRAVIWRGPMLMGALQQLLGDVDWGELDVLLVDLPPGTGDVQLSLCQRTKITGAVIVSTPQDVALLDARRAIDMFNKLDAPVLGLVENMSTYICPNCGHEAHLFGHGGVREEAGRLGLPFLGEIPLDLSVRLSGDQGVPVAAGEGPVADAYASLAAGLVRGGIA